MPSLHNVFRNPWGGSYFSAFHNCIYSYCLSQSHLFIENSRIVINIY